MPTPTIDGGGGRYDQQSKIQRKKNDRTNLATIQEPHDSNSLYFQYSFNYVHFILTLKTTKD
jgi:hypothetical protein